MHPSGKLRAHDPSLGAGERLNGMIRYDDRTIRHAPSFREGTTN